MKKKLEEILTADHNSRMTAKKVVEKLECGYEISGLVIIKPETGERCIIEMSAGRWLNKEEMRWLMHESESPLNNKA